MTDIKKFLKTTILLITAYFQRIFHRRTIAQQEQYINSIQSDLDYTRNELRSATKNLQEAKDIAQAAKTFADGVKAENKRFADAQLRIATDIGAANQRVESMREELANEKIGYSSIDATNRALESRLKGILVEMFPKGPGMYMVNFDEKTRQAYPFRIPLALQKKITRILTDTQKTALKKKKI